MLPNSQGIQLQETMKEVDLDSNSDSETKDESPKSKTAFGISSEKDYWKKVGKNIIQPTLLLLFLAAAVRHTGKFKN